MWGKIARGRRTRRKLRTRSLQESAHHTSYSSVLAQGEDSRKHTGNMPEKNVTPSRLQQLKSRLSPRWQLTLFGRSLLLFVAELLVNAIIWAVALALFAPHQRTRCAAFLIGCVI